MDTHLKSKILSDLKDAFRSGDATRKMVLSLINAAIKNEEIEARVDARAGVLSDADILALIRREIKQHEESLLEAKNAIPQAKHFKEATQLTGVVLTKLDGTAKGGVVFAIGEELALPVRFVGTGEKITDLAEFSAEAFVAGLFEK